jgi:membrane fusion protein, multidrug efflux system
MNRRGRLLLTLPLLASAAATGCQQAKSGPVKSNPTVLYDTPVTLTVTDYEEFPGDIDTPYSVQVTARVSGYLNDPVYFKDGTMIEKDAKLFQIDPRMYQADLHRAEGTVAQYEAHVERLKKEYVRAKNLLSSRSVSQEEHDRYKADYDEAVASLEVAKANRDLASLNLEWTEVRAPISGMLSRRMVDPGNLVKADTTVMTSIVSLDPLYVYFDVHEQAMLRIKRLMQEGKLKLQAQGEKAVPVQIGLADETDFPHRGVVDFTDNRVDLNTGTLRFRARIDNPADAHGNRFIVPGLFVRVRLPIGEAHPALMVREQAMVTDQGRKTVYVVKEKKDDKGQPVINAKGQPTYVAMVRDVGAVGVLRDGLREVEKGIEPGDWVIVEGMQRVRPGLEVQAEKYAEKATADNTKSAPTSAKAEPAVAKASLGDAGDHRVPAQAKPAGAISGPGLAQAKAVVKTKPTASDSISNGDASRRVPAAIRSPKGKLDSTLPGSRVPR